MTDREKKALIKLQCAYRDYGKIVIGVDFDNTIYKYDDYSTEKECKQVRDLLKKLEPHATLCMWTVADNFSLGYKKFIAKEHYALNFEYFNESPIKLGATAKPFFNILLDDNAGLDSAITILEEYLLWRINYPLGDIPI